VDELTIKLELDDEDEDFMTSFKPRGLPQDIMKTGNMVNAQRTYKLDLPANAIDPGKARAAPYKSKKRPSEEETLRLFPAMTRLYTKATFADSDEDLDEENKEKLIEGRLQEIKEHYDTAGKKVLQLNKEKSKAAEHTHHQHHNHNHAHEKREDDDKRSSEISRDKHGHPPSIDKGRGKGDQIDPNAKDRPNQLKQKKMQELKKREQLLKKQKGMEFKFTTFFALCSLTNMKSF